VKAQDNERDQRTYSYDYDYTLKRIGKTAQVWFCGSGENTQLRRPSHSHRRRHRHTRRRVAVPPESPGRRRRTNARLNGTVRESIDN